VEDEPKPQTAREWQEVPPFQQSNIEAVRTYIKSLPALAIASALAMSSPILSVLLKDLVHRPRRAVASDVVKELRKSGASESTIAAPSTQKHSSKRRPPLALKLGLGKGISHYRQCLLR
jgi:hypothetical protein